MTEETEFKVYRLNEWQVSEEFAMIEISSVPEPAIDGCWYGYSNRGRVPSVEEVLVGWNFGIEDDDDEDQDAYWIDWMEEGF
jgi:hypothetical protein